MSCQLEIIGITKNTKCGSLPYIEIDCLNKCRSYRRKKILNILNTQKYLHPCDNFHLPSN